MAAYHRVYDSRHLQAEKERVVEGVHGETDE